jgi:hypothetical protein
MRENQLPVSAARWNHCSKICFVTFSLKNNKIAKNSTITIKARETIRTDLESLEFL